MEVDTAIKCRICRQEAKKDVVSLKQRAPFGRIFYADVYQYVTGFQRVLESGPQFLCRVCTIDLSVAFDFKKKCVRSEKVYERFPTGVKKEVAEEENYEPEEKFEEKDEEPQMPSTIICVPEFMDEDSMKKEDFSENDDRNSVSSNDADDVKDERMSEDGDEPKSEEDEERKKKLEELLSQNTHDPIEGDKFKCPFCPEIFKTIGSIIDHIHYEHEGRKMECDEEDCVFRCELQFQMYKHKIRCHSKDSVKPMLCPFCRNFSGYGMAIVAHCRETHLDQQKNCPHEGCDITYFFDYQIARHLKNSHKTRKTIVTHRLDGRKGKLHQCLKCDKIFNTRGQLGKHQFEEYGIPMPINKKDPHLKETTLCPQCGKSMKVSSLKVHIELVHSKFAAGCFICDICGNNYSTKISLTNHIKYAHMERKPIKCRHCDQMFPNVGSRRYHEVKTHTEFKHVCSICGLKCFNPTNLRDHFATHTGETNFQCAICEKKFKRRYILKNHMYIHSDSRPFSCSICESTFKTKNYLNSHMKVHEK